MAAVCRCFPGKASSDGGGGDRVPAAEEIAACGRWMARELELLQPRLIIPIGKLALATVLGADRPLVEVIGQRAVRDGRDVFPLPHPSGASTWFKRSPGRELTEQALALLGQHPAWREVFPEGAMHPRARP
jgi:uracil-DNA glycosylase